MLITRRLAEAKLYPTTTPMLESRGSVKCKSAADYTKSSFLLQGGGVLRAKKSPDIPPKPTIQAGLNWLAARSWRSTCIGSAVLSLFDCMRPWRSTRTPPQKPNLFFCTTYCWFNKEPGTRDGSLLNTATPQHHTTASRLLLIPTSLIPNTRPPKADPKSPRFHPKKTTTTTQDCEQDSISHHHRQHHSFAFFSRLLQRVYD